MIGILVLLGAAAVLSPFIVRLGRVAPWLLAAPPAFGFGWFLLRVVDGLRGTALETRIPWVDFLGIEFAFRLDGLSALFALLILGVGSLIVLYGGRYLSEHPQLGRFYLLLFAFMASMLGVVLADDALTLFVFWEGTSLTSYLLIGFDHEQEDCRVAARKALVVTGTGGLALLGGLILVHQITGSWALSDWIAQADAIRQHPLSSWALALVVVGAFTKSAQVPFHFWLPAAMAGPTPVSAYLHSATMVKAGVFLLARLSPVWAGTPEWLWVLTPIGAATMLFSAWAGLGLRDMKSVLAYTTTMALGLMVMLLGLGDEHSVHAAVAYLIVHAMYKGALFMCAGSIDHGTGTRDLDQLSGLSTSMRLTLVATVLAAASMAGLPPFVGFVGKELAYEANLHGGGVGQVVLGVSVLANVALFAVAYAVGVAPFFGRPSQAAQHAHEDPWLAAPPLVLSTLGLLSGLMPGRLDALLGAAASAIQGEPTSVHLALWHGFNPALAASVVTYIAGVGLVAAFGGLRGQPAFGAAVRAFADAPGRLFERALFGAARVSRALIDRIYVGMLRRYVLVVVGTAVLGLVVSMATRERLSWPSPGPVLPHEIALLLILVGSSGLAALVDKSMKAIISVGISGYCVAMVYLLFGAPDVAMTQFSIETLTVILVVLTLLHLPDAALERPRRASVARDFVIAFGTGGAVTALLLATLAGPLPSRISDWYLAHSVPDAHGHNVVNVILVDFRGFDTWGEITVLTIAGLGVYALFRRRARDPSDVRGDREPSEEGR